jgi:hypothetical protein
MAATLDQVAEFLENRELKFHRDDEADVIHFGMKTDAYLDSDGDNMLRIAIDLSENGEFIKVIAPRAYEYKEGPHKLALFETLLIISWNTKMIQFEYDPSDGEVRAIIEFPLEDALLTERQLMRTLTGLIHIIDSNDAAVRRAIEEGEIDVDNDKGSQIRAMIEHLQGMLPDEEEDTLVEAPDRL